MLIEIDKQPIREGPNGSTYKHSEAVRALG
jgi:hypothetical protein